MAFTVEAAFSELLDRQRLTTNQVSVANARIGALQTFFDNNFTMAENVFKAGSFARGTICAGQKDVDLMAPLSYSAYRETYDNNSSTFLYFVRNRLNARYSATNVSSRRVAVTLDFTNITADIVPCFRREGTGGGYFMPDGNGQWLATNPKYHLQEIANSNDVHHGRLKPLVRLIKAWNLANGNHLQSFHTEVLVYTIWKNNFMHATLTDNVKATLDVLASWVDSPSYDPWNPSIRIDNYLNLQTRALVVRMLNEDSAIAGEAQQLVNRGYIFQAFEKWNSIYRHTFPAYG